MTSGSDLYSDRESFVRSKIEVLNRYNAEIGDGEQVEYKEEEDDEKRVYWMVQHKVPASSHSPDNMPWWHLFRRVPITAHVASGSLTIGFVAVAALVSLRCRFTRK